MIGSDDAFSGHASYFREHGDYKIFDYNTAVSEGMILEECVIYVKKLMKLSIVM